MIENRASVPIGKIKTLKEERIVLNKKSITYNRGRVKIMVTRIPENWSLEQLIEYLRNTYDGLNEYIEVCNFDFAFWKDEERFPVFTKGFWKIKFEYNPFFRTFNAEEKGPYNKVFTINLEKLGYDIAPESLKRILEEYDI